MDWIKEKNARNELKRILFDLSESQDMLCDASVRAQIYVRLEKLYCVGQGDEGFYLFQSDVFSVLYTVAQGTSRAASIFWAKIWSRYERAIRQKIRTARGIGSI